MIYPSTVLGTYQLCHAITLFTLVLCDAVDRDPKTKMKLLDLLFLSVIWPVTWLLLLKLYWEDR